MPTTAQADVVNGVDRNVLFGALDAVSGMPELASFEFRARNEWVSGTHSTTVIDDFYGLGDEQTHTVPRSYDADHPTQLGASDAGPTPVEFLLHALAACITAGIGNIAAARNVELTRVASTVKGAIDLQGILGLDDEVRNGFSGIEISFEIEGNGDVDALRAVVEQGVARSAVYDVLANGVPVTVDIVAG